jgi:hypothetical protein
MTSTKPRRYRIAVVECGHVGAVTAAFLAIRISFVNEIVALCEALRADVDTVIQGMACPRIYDARNYLSRDLVEAAGLVYRGIGRPAGQPARSNVTTLEMAVCGK